MEIVLCSLGLILLAPLLLLITLLIKMTSPGPALFRQERVGQLGQSFRLLKFRSMEYRLQGEGMQLTVCGDNRVTKLGALLRHTKLDELPQLWNVVRGDMALVGPRPEVPCYVRHYPQLFSLALQQRPGITDVCTLHLRREEDILALVDDPERYYIDTLLPRKLGASIREGWRRTFWRDLSVLVATVVPSLSFLAPAADFRPLADLYTLTVTPDGPVPIPAYKAAAAAQGGRTVVREMPPASARRNATVAEMPNRPKPDA